MDLASCAQAPSVHCGSRHRCFSTCAISFRGLYDHVLNILDIYELVSSHMQHASLIVNVDSVHG